MIDNTQNYKAVNSIGNRLNQFTRTLPENLRETIDSYLTVPGSEISDLDMFQMPFWMLLPDMFSMVWPKAKKDSRFCEDILWAQLSVFLHFRIEDDLLDGDSDNELLMDAGQRFLHEGKMMFLNYFDSASHFQAIYNSLLKDSRIALSTVDKLEKNFNTDPHLLREKYIELAGLLNLASAAYCSRYNRMNEYDDLTCFGAKMTMAGQICDDLKDLEQDLKRSRYNYAGNILLNRLREIEPQCGSSLDSVCRAMILTSGVEELFSEIEDDLHSAENICRKLGLNEMVLLINFYRERTSLIRWHFHGKRADYFFNRI
ncbi:MAG: hypothetical protein AB7T22_07345 [Calditrichaceae bacterium]